MTKLRLILYFMRKNKVWDYYIFLKGLIFNINKFNYRLTIFIQEQRENSSDSVVFFKLASYSLAIPFLISLFLYVTTDFFNGLLGRYSLTLDPTGNYGTLLGVVTSVSGVFIGLYFSSMVALTGVIYANINDKIRRVLVNDRLSGFYLKYLAAFAVFGVFQLCLNCVGVKANSMSVLFILLGSALAIFSFIPLSKRMFELFDPSRLSSIIINELMKSTRKVSVGSALWYEPNFQAHELKMAKRNLSVLFQLCDTIERNQIINGHRFVGVAKELVQFLSIYRRLKNKIPTKSMWFEEVREYEKLFFIPSFKLEANFSTSTLPNPKLSNNHSWLEDDCFEVIMRCLKVNIANGRFDETIDSISVIQHYLEQSSFDGDLKLSIKLMEDVYNEFISPNNIKYWTVKDESLVKVVGLWDYLSIMPIVLFLSYSNYVKSLNLELVNSKVELIDWRDKRSIYMRGFSRQSLEYLEGIKDKISWEVSIEGFRVTSNKQVSNDIIKTERSIIQSGREDVIDLLSSFFDKSFWFLIENNLHLLSHVVFSKKEEFISKVISNKGNLEIGDKSDEWTNTIEKWLAKQDAEKSKMLIAMHKGGSVLSHVNIPDYNGHRCYWLTSELFHYLYINDFESAKRIYLCTFNESINLFFSLYNDNEIAGSNELDKVAFSIPPLMNFLEVTGIALLLSDYYGCDEMKNIIYHEWDRYIGDNPQRVDFIYMLYDSVDNLMTVNMENLRFKWERQVSSLLKNIPFEYSHGKWEVMPSKIFMHESSLVRFFANQDDINFYKFYNVFFAEYIMGGKYADNSRAPQNVKGLLRSMKEEKAIYEKFMFDGEV